jgi:hypothetical protein
MGSWCFFGEGVWDVVLVWLACREERRGWREAASEASEVSCSDDGVCSGRVGGCRMKVRYIAAMAIRCGGWRRQSWDLYVSLIMDLRCYEIPGLEAIEKNAYQAVCNEVVGNSS